MSQSLTDTVVEFELRREDLDKDQELLEWILQLDPATWWNEKDTNGRIIGISFKYEQDAIAFKLKFNLL